MFEPFPGNYVWNLSVSIALATGGIIGETDRACRPLLASAPASEEEATEAFFASWCALADTLVELADEDEARGRLMSAGHKHHRASVYYQTAERMQAHGYAPRKEAYEKTLRSFGRFLKLTGQPAERVEVAFEGSAFPGILMHADNTDGPVPCVIMFNGLDSTKEQFYGSGLPLRLREMGIASLMVDSPGSGEALRLRGLTARPESEDWAAACIDFLRSRPEVDSSLIGLVAWSLGGYYGPRATAFEPRIAFSVAWGANYDWGRVQQERLANSGARPVPHYWEHVCWVWGAEDIDEFMTIAPKVTLRGIMDRVRVPFLVVHGENDRQISPEYAHALYDDLVNSPKRELKIFTEREGGVEHCSVDDMPVVVDYIADWVAETVDELRSAANPDD